MDLVWYAQSDDLRLAQDWTMFTQADGSIKSNTYAALAVGPFPALQAGDIVSAELSHELDNTNPGDDLYKFNPAGGGPWPDGDPARWLQGRYGWAMASTRVYLGSPANLGERGAILPSQSGAKYVLLPQETNWDWNVHHLGISRTGSIRLTAAIPWGWYMYDMLYFKAGAYWKEGATKIHLNTTPYCRLTAQIVRP